MNMKLKTRGSKEPKEVQKEEDYQTYLLWKSAQINNERKFINWVQGSIALLTLGFIIERFQLFLQTIGGKENTDKMPQLPPFVETVTIAFFIIGGAVIIIATIEYFLDRHRINLRNKESAITIDILVICILLLLVFISIVLLFPGN